MAGRPPSCPMSVFVGTTKDDSHSSGGRVDPTRLGAPRRNPQYARSAYRVRRSVPNRTQDTANRVIATSAGKKNGRPIFGLQFRKDRPGSIRSVHVEVGRFIGGDSGCRRPQGRGGAQQGRNVGSLVIGDCPQPASRATSHQFRVRHRPK